MSPPIIGHGGVGVVTTDFYHLVINWPQWETWSEYASGIKYFDIKQWMLLEKCEFTWNQGQFTIYIFSLIEWYFTFKPCSSIANIKSIHKLKYNKINLSNQISKHVCWKTVTNF